MNKRILCLLLCAAIMMAVFSGCRPSDDLLASTSGSTEVSTEGVTEHPEDNTEETTQTEPPVTEPPVTEPPVTEPPATEPPVTEPPVTEPPVTEPPATEPPVTEPEPEPETYFTVGYGRVNITPTKPVYLGGLGSEDPPRISTEIKNQLYATCIAYTDKAGNTVLMYHLDLLNAYDYIVAQRPNISKATGVPKGNIIIASTHNHSGVSFTIASPDSYLGEYKTMLCAALLDAAKAALEDRKPAEMYITTTNPVNLNFVRHYVYADGTINGYYGSTSSVGHAVPVDNQMQLIKFVREGGKDVVLMNWQGHPRGHSQYRYAVLSDVDVIRQKIEKELDCQFAFFLGASGNVNNSSAIPSEKRTKDYVEHGNALAAEAIAAAVNFKKAETGILKIDSQYVKVTRKETDNNFSEYIEVSVFGFGDIGFVIAGYEMFCENGMDIKNASPFKMTFVVTCANGDHKYMPSYATFEYSSYEGDATRYARGTAEKLANKYISMLKSIKKS